MLLQKRARYIASTGRFGIGQSSSAATARFRDLVRAAEAGPRDGSENAGYRDLLLSSRNLKITPKKRTATTTTTTTTPMTDAQLKALIAQGVADAIEKIKANETIKNGNDS
nr:hypothetical protein [Tanacetum cinerariifolium]